MRCVESFPCSRTVVWMYEIRFIDGNETWMCQSRATPFFSGTKNMAMNATT